MIKDLELVNFADPALKNPPSEFDFEKEDAKVFAEELLQKMRQLKGVGLSANQLGLDQRVFVMEVASSDFKRTLFNPTLLAVSDKQSIVKEGCLSLPGFWLNVRRPIECTIKYYNEEGVEVIEQFKDVAARIALHEYDHMLGQNFTMRVSKFKYDRAVKALDKKVKRYTRLRKT